MFCCQYFQIVFDALLSLGGHPSYITLSIFRKLVSNDNYCRKKQWNQWKKTIIRMIGKATRATRWKPILQLN